MKWPLPANTFPSLELSLDDRVELENLANVFITEALRQYDEHRVGNRGVVDLTRWKVIKTRDALTAYEDKLAPTLLRKESVVTENSVVKMEGGAAKRRLQSILSFGTVPGDLDDLMYGMIHPTTEMLKIKTAYMEDKIADHKVLAALIDPTPEDPVRGLHIKWSVSEFAPLLLRRLIRPRDFLYLESTGIHTSPESGERIGFSLLHSIEIPSIRELHEYKIVRGSMSICGLYRQKSPGVMELYVKGFVDPLGDLKESIAAVATAEACMSFGMSIHCAQMKKLNWMLTKRGNTGYHKASHLNTDGCCVCSRDVSSRSRTCCRVCMGRMCSRCRVPKKLAFLSPLTRKVVMKSMTFCTRCMHEATTTNALVVAHEEVATKFGAFEMGSSLCSSPTASVGSMRSTTFDSIIG